MDCGLTMRKYSGILIAAFVLSSCASLTQEQCEMGDWEQIGQRDARLGHRPDRLDQHVEACKRYKITISDNAYFKGYKQGQLQYCTISNGYEVGRKGYRYRGICPPSKFSGFEPAYEKGRLIHDIETNISSAQYDRNQVQEQIYVVGKEPYTAERDRQVRRLKNEKDRLTDEIHRLRRQKERALLEAELFLREQVPGI